MKEHISEGTGGDTAGLTVSTKPFAVSESIEDLKRKGETSFSEVSGLFYSRSLCIVVYPSDLNVYGSVSVLCNVDFSRQSSVPPVKV